MCLKYNRKINKTTVNNCPFLFSYSRTKCFRIFLLFSVFVISSAFRIFGGIQLFDVYFFSSNVFHIPLAYLLLSINSYFEYRFSCILSSNVFSWLTALSFFMVTFSPVSLLTVTNWLFFISRGPSSRRIGTPCQFTMIYKRS